MTDAVIVLTTTGSKEEAERIAETLVEERLAACVTIVPRVKSVYRWKGRVEKSEEYLLLIKTVRGLYGRLEERIRGLHSYELPEILAVSVDRGLEEYLRWVAGETGD